MNEGALVRRKHCRRQFIIFHQSKSHLFTKFFHHCFTNHSRVKTPKPPSILSGHEMWVNELLNGDDEIFYKNLGMKKSVFVELRGTLQIHKALSDTRWVSSTEQLALLLHFLVTGLSYPKLNQRFQRSPSTVSNIIYHLTTEIIKNTPFIKSQISLPQQDHSSNKSDNPDRYPYFKNCVGVVDCTHLPVTVPPQEALPFLSQQGETSQKIFIACDFDLLFTFVLAGYEGSMEDNVVWDYAKQNNFIVPDGKYVLGDAGFDLDMKCQTPFKGFKYHHRESSGNDAEPQNYQELYNKRHATLRNDVERIKGAVKKRFKVMEKGSKESIEIQVKLVILMVYLHNFIRRNDPDDDHFKEEFMEDDHLQIRPQFQEVDADEETDEESTEAVRLRRKIAKAMWRLCCLERNQN